MRTQKHPRESEAIMTELVFPNDTNSFSNLMGGRLMYLMDVAGAICAQRHSGQVVVTASIDQLDFKKSIPTGAIVTLRARVTRSFRTSMEIHIVASYERISHKEFSHSNEAFYTYVAVGPDGTPMPVPELVPETEAEEALYQGALHRRQLRLVLAGKLSLKEAPELSELLGATDIIKDPKD